MEKEATWTVEIGHHGKTILLEDADDDSKIMMLSYLLLWRQHSENDMSHDDDDDCNISIICYVPVIQQVCTV